MPVATFAPGDDTVSRDFITSARIVSIGVLVTVRDFAAVRVPIRVGFVQQTGGTDVPE